VAGYGGRTAIVGDAKNHATRDLLARIQDQGRTTDQADDRSASLSGERTTDQASSTKDQAR
jgi:hypothetical protein